MLATLQCNLQRGQWRILFTSTPFRVREVRHSHLPHEYISENRKIIKTAFVEKNLSRIFRLLYLQHVS
jgi:hypothetical protein